MSDTSVPRKKRTLWSRAEEMALKAPPSRNRYVDFLRAFSILAVVVGHWLVAAPYIEDGVVQGGHLLGIQPWTQWLSWGFQVMPIFFLVGGFSNGAWFTGRLQRLVNPVLPLFLIWTMIALFGKAMGIDPTVVKLATQLALIPVWFLSVYLIVAALVPFTHAAWERFGIASFFALVACAVLVDVATYAVGVPYLNFVNFAFVWIAVHQLGYAWNDGFFASPSRALAWGILGVTQTGLLLALEPAGRRMLDNLKTWTGVVLVNGMIMTVYLWHLTAFILVMIGAWVLGGIGLETPPGSGTWWLARPIWFVLYVVALLPLIAVFARYERSSGNDADGDLPHWRLI